VSLLSVPSALTSDVESFRMGFPPVARVSPVSRRADRFTLGSLEDPFVTDRRLSLASTRFRLTTDTLASTCRPDFSRLGGWDLNPRFTNMLRGTPPKTPKTLPT